MPTYKAPVDDTVFLLNDVFDYARYANAPGFAEAPIDVVGTGSFIPDRWHETYATADIVEYDGVPMVKIGREFLLRKSGERRRGG